MASEYIEVDLDKEEKQAILKHASLFVTDPTTNSDLLNKRKKWIRFNRNALTDVIGAPCVSDSCLIISTDAKRLSVLFPRSINQPSRTF